MIRLLALLVLALLLAAPARAQEPARSSPPPVTSPASVAVVDARGVLVGYVQGFGAPAWAAALALEFPMVVLRGGARSARLYVLPFGLLGNSPAEFPTGDCTGPVYVRASSLVFTDFALFPDSALHAGGVYQARPGSGGRTIVVRSEGDFTGRCATFDTDFPEEFVVPATRVMDLGAKRWTPPFRIR